MRVTPLVVSKLKCCFRISLMWETVVMSSATWALIPSRISVCINPPLRVIDQNKEWICKENSLSKIGHHLNTCYCFGAGDDVSPLQIRRKLCWTSPASLTTGTTSTALGHHQSTLSRPRILSTTIYLVELGISQYILLLYFYIHHFTLHFIFSISERQVESQFALSKS